MKKRIAYLLLSMMLVLGTFTGCGLFNFGGDKDTEVVQDDDELNEEESEKQLKKAVAYVKSIYKDVEKETAADYERIGTVPVGKVKFTVDWSVDVDENIIKIVKQENGMVTIDINEEIGDETPYVLTATISDDKGNKETLTWDHVIPAKITGSYADIVDMAYALKNGEKLPNVATLQGTVTSVKTAWDASYKNITVVIAVEGREDKPIECYRLKSGAADASKIKKGDLITVTGYLKNYNGTIEFDAGCVLDENQVGAGKINKVKGTMLEIVAKAYKLKDGEMMDAEATLAGSVISVDTEWSDSYKNITVTIVVDGSDKAHKIECYRLKSGAADASKIKAGDHITVTGYLKNYKGKIEFDAGCTLDKLVVGGGTVALDPKPEEKPEVIVPPTSSEGIKTGDRIVIYSKKGVALTTEKSSYKYVGTEITFSGDKLLYGSDACIYVVEITDKGTYKFKLEKDGKYFSAYEASGGYINLTYDGTYTEWELIDLGSGLYNLKLLGAPASNFGDYFLEYYPGKNPGWTVYADSDEDAKKDEIYQIGFYVIPKEVEPAKASEALALLKTDLAKLNLTVTGENTLPSTISVAETTFDVTWKVETEHTGNAKVEGQKLTLLASETADIPFKLVATVTDSKDATNTASEAISYTVAKVAVPTAEEVLAELEVTDPLTEKVTIDNTVKEYTYTIVWTVETEKAEHAENVKIVATEDGKKQLVITPSATEAINYTLSVTVTNADNAEDVASKSWDKTVDMASLEKITDKDVMHVYHGNLGKTLYINGKTGSAEYYLATTDTILEAVEIVKETVDGGYRFYFLEGDTKKYIDIYYNTEVSKAYARITTSPTAVYTEHTVAGVYKANIEGTDYFLGISNSGTYDTLQAVQLSSYNYNYALKFENVRPAYKMSLNQEYRNEVLYFTGNVVPDKTYLFTTTTNPNAAVDIYLESVEGVEGGVRFYFNDGTSKQYIDVYKNGDYVNLRLATEEDTDKAVYKYDPAKGIYVTTINEVDYYISSGSSISYDDDGVTKYSVNTTISVNPLSDFTKYYPVVLEEVNTIKSNENTVVTSEATYSMMSLNHTKSGSKVYFTGKIDEDGYFTTTTESEDAVNVYVEFTINGYHLYFNDSTNGKTYIDLYDSTPDEDSPYVKMRFVTENELNGENPPVLSGWTYDADLNLYVVDFDDNGKYTIGIKNTNTYTSLTAFKTTNLSKYDVLNFEQRVVPYKLTLFSAGNGDFLYFNGSISSNRLSGTVDVTKAVDVYAEEATGGVRFFFMNEGVKTYIDIANVSTTETPSYKVQLTTTPTGSPYTYNAELNTYVVTYGEVTYFLGSSSNYTNMEAKKLYADNSYYVGFFIKPDDIVEESLETE